MSITIGLLGASLTEEEYRVGGAAFLRHRQIEEIERRILALEAAQGGEAGTAETGTGSVHEHPVGEAEAPTPSSETNP